MIIDDEELKRRFESRTGFTDPPYFFMALILVGIFVVILEMFKMLQYGR